MAFKEWAIVVDALGRGEQIVILRKGGLCEGPGGFKVEHDRFLLFPTRFHQQRDSVVPHAQERYIELAADFPSHDVLRLEYCVEVVDCRRIETLSQALDLEGQHIWKESVVRSRFDWSADKGVMALAVRVSRLGARVDLPMHSDYGGCKSWVELQRDLDTSGATCVVSDECFAEKLSRFRAVFR